MENPHSAQMPRAARKLALRHLPVTTVAGIFLSCD
jgi:hypothetical protein